ncbi:MAG TPA: hypothetical protein DCO77_10870 [Nitrospiraceae bacterium]|nr:hypothetical protein [Nitrospiraceae bacterium]
MTKRPTWVTVVGIIGIILGCFGLLGAGQTILMPTIMEFQREMFSGFQKAFDNDPHWNQSNRGSTDKTEEFGREKKARPHAFPPKEFFAMFDRMLDMPAWFSTWALASGITALFVYGFYLYASIMLLLMKRPAVRLFTIALSVAIAFSLVKTGVAFASQSFMVFSMLAGGLFGIVVNTVLLIVIATSDKQAFAQHQPSPPPA